MFSSNQAYQQRSGSFKKRIQSGDQYSSDNNSLIIKIVTNAIRNLLTYRDLENIDDIAKVEAMNRCTTVLK